MKDRTWRGSKNLLAAAVHGVHLPVIPIKRHSTQGAHRVYRQQRTVLSAEVSHASQALVDSCAGITL